MKALILTYYWPPSGGSGVQRWMYFAKYLQEFGIEPVVVTVDEKFASYSSTDESHLEKIRHVRVYKTNTLEPLRFYSFLKSGNAKSGIPQGNVGGKKKGLMDKFATYVRANFFIPDARVGWNRYAYAKAAELIQQEHFDVVITTGPPHSTHLVGLKLKEKLNVKWIADFRDPWTEIYYNDLFKRTPKNQQKDQSMELSVMEKADRVLTASPSMKKMMAAKVPGQVEKFSHIYNGFDAEKLKAVQRKPNAQFTICYVGILSSNYTYQAFITALENSVQKHPEHPVTLNLTGRIEPDVLASFEKIKYVDLVIRGNVPHQQALETMANADLLLLILPANEGAKIIVPGKLFEYAACDVPVLGILDPKSDSADVIRKYTRGEAFSAGQVDEIEAFITNARNGKFPEKGTGDADEFDRRNTARQLSELIHAMKS